MISLKDIEQTQFQSTHQKMDCIDINKFKNWKLFFLQRKYNGVYGLLIIDSFGEAKLYNKTMSIVPNTSDIVLEARNKLPQGFVYIGELVIARNGKEDFEEASRCYNPNSNVVPDGETKFVIFDKIKITDFMKGCSDEFFINRWDSIYSDKEKYVSWDKIDFSYTSQISSYDYFEFIHKKGLTDGWEGDIIILPHSKWNRRVKSTSSFKLIPIPTIDLLIININEGKGKHAKVAGTIEYEFYPFLDKTKQKISIPIDGSLTYDVRKDAYLNPHKYIGSISKISYKGFTRYGKLRQPKIIELIRHDKFKSDFE